MAEETQVVETVEEQVVPEAKQPQDEKSIQMQMWTLSSTKSLRSGSQNKKLRNRKPRKWLR